MAHDFLRKLFYIEPPESGASVEDWESWLKKDTKQAGIEKAKNTRINNKEAIENGDIYDLSTEGSTLCVSYQGRFIQTPVAIVGNEDDNHLEPICAPDQEKTQIVSDWETNKRRRGTKSKFRNARRRLNKQRTR